MKDADQNCSNLTAQLRRIDEALCIAERNLDQLGVVLQGKTPNSSAVVAQQRDNIEGLAVAIVANAHSLMSQSAHLLQVVGTQLLKEGKPPAEIGSALGRPLRG